MAPSASGAGTSAQLLRPGQDQRRAAELVGPGDERGRGADAGDLLDDDGAGEGVGADAVVLLRHVGSVEVGGHERVVGGGREGRGPVDLSGIRTDLVLGDGPDRLADGVVVLGEPEQVEVGVVCHVVGPFRGRGVVSRRLGLPTARGGSSQVVRAGWQEPGDEGTTSAALSRNNRWPPPSTTSSRASGRRTRSVGR